MTNTSAPARATRSVEPELVALRRLAEELAKGRTERTTTGHLLAAVASQPGCAADLLRERRLEAEVLLKAARVTTDDASDGVARAIQRARELAARSPDREPTAIHLLFALCQERRSAAHRTLEQCGVDVTKLRTAAIQLAMGLAPERRNPPLRHPLLQAPAASPTVPAAVGPFPPAPPPATHPVTLSSSPVSPPVLRDRPPQSPPSPTRAPQPSVTTLPKPKRPRAASAAVHHRAPLGQAGGGHVAASKGSGEGRFALDPKIFPTLATLGRNLTLAAARGELEPVVGRQEEIERTLDVLAKKRANSPCLVGAVGVGKTSVVRGVALRIAMGTDVASLDDRILIEIEPSALLSGTGMRGALAERVAQIKVEAQRAEGRIVVFFDEMHALFADPADEGAAELKSALAKGELVCIGATTESDCRRLFESDPVLARRLTPVEILPLLPEDAFLVLEQIAPTFGAHHHVRYTTEALAAAIAWSVRYVPGRALPDQAIGVLDLAGARAHRRSLALVGPEQVAEVVSELVEVPVERLLETDGARMLRLEELLAKRIVGHSGALARIAAVLRRNASGLRGKRPIGSFLLLGPTGVGKTETAKAVAECLFASQSAMTRLDLSEYAEAHAIARLIGSPPGYIGHEAGGQLTEAVRKRPYQVVLLDEIEKAHPDVLEAFLQVLDEGQLTDGRGRTVDFTNTVILLTSNLGADILRSGSRHRGAAIGFGGRAASPETEASAREEQVIQSARSALPPELYNRIDEVLAFAPLTKEDVAEVARRMLGALSRDLEAARGVRLDVDDAAVDVLLELGGYDEELGARPMRRAIARHIEAKIAEMILRGELERGSVALVDVEEGRISIDAVREA
jgi:ATP-dependent Clp protease ATP-binding subunit ClpC